MTAMELRTADRVQTAPLTAIGLIGGYLVARETGIRPLGGLVLGAAGAYAARTWWARGGLGQAAGLTSVYLASFGLSHPLAKKIGAWPAVLAVTGFTAGAAYAISDYPN